MTTHWKVGGHWFVGTAESPATALEVTIGNANEFTVGFYNFVCLGFYLDATVGPLVEFIAPFPYCVFPGILLEIILPQKQILAAAVVAGTAAAAGALVGEMGGVGAGVAAGAVAGGVATYGASAAIAAADMFQYSACQMDVVYGNYFFTVYGECYDWQPEDCYHHDAVDHFHSAKQTLHSVVKTSTENVGSKAVYAARGLAIQAEGQIAAESKVATTVFGNTGVTIAATTTLTFSAPTVILSAPEIAVQTPSAAITLQAAASLIAPTLYLNGVQSFVMGDFVPVPMGEPPIYTQVSDAQAALDDALAAYEAEMSGHGHAAPGQGHHP